MIWQPMTLHWHTLSYRIVFIMIHSWHTFFEFQQRHNDIYPPLVYHTEWVYYLESFPCFHHPPPLPRPLSDNHRAFYIFTGLHFSRMTWSWNHSLWPFFNWFHSLSNQLFTFVPWLSHGLIAHFFSVLKSIPLYVPWFICPFTYQKTSWFPPSFGSYE